MLFEEDVNGFVTIKCEKCGAIHKIHRVYYTRYGDEYHFNPPVSCCGKSARIVYKNRPTLPAHREPELIKCPSCGSTQITAGHKGFGVGTAAAGGIILGLVGLLAGLIGSNQVLVTCLNCGRQWEAGRR